MKLHFILLSYVIIQQTSAGCPDQKLFCFDQSNNVVGDIMVGQCWNWNRLTCLPCSAVLKI